MPRPPPPLEQDRWGTSGIDAFPSQLGWIIWILRFDKIWTSPLALRKYPKFVLNNRLDVDFSFSFLTLQGHNATSLLVPVHVHKELRARCIGSYPKPLLACLPFRCWICMETYKYVQYVRITRYDILLYVLRLWARLLLPSNGKVKDGRDLRFRVETDQPISFDSNNV